VASPLDCAQPRYSEVLTGAARKEPRRIVDVIGVGHRLGVIELRLLENWDVVDVFVLYEVPYTQVGAPKPMYFNTSFHHSRRWDRFKSKLLYYAPTDAELKVYLEKEATAIWTLEIARMTLPIVGLQTLDHPLAKAVREWARSPDSVILQNDSDEMIGEPALRHLRLCEIKPGAVPIEGAAVA
jgi:hypothetical protein